MNSSEQHIKEALQKIDSLFILQSMANFKETMSSIYSLFIYFVVYVTTLLLTQFTQYNIEWLNELERMWKEVIIV
jgi:hypothetical protein